jgi:hypothetical protein
MQDKKLFHLKEMHGRNVKGGRGQFSVDEVPLKSFRCKESLTRSIKKIIEQHRYMCAGLVVSKILVPAKFCLLL